MGLIELLLTGVGLSMDAFAVSICKGLCMRRVNYRHTFLIALFFGGFQALMPLAGWLLGRQFEQYIVAVDHWIAFGLLAIIGGNMIREACKDAEEVLSCEVEPKLDLKELTLMAIATSIDALAVGISFAFLRVRILPAITVIGVTTFVICVGGVFVGNRFGTRYQKKAAIAGGVILILLGLKILLEHLGILVL